MSGRNWVACLAPVILVLVLVFSSCVTTSGTEGSQSAVLDESYSGPMPEISAKANTGRAWGGDQLAEFTHGFEYQGVTGLRVTQDYGATIWSYNFSDLPPNTPIQMRIDLNLDTTENNSWVELFWGPGHYDAPQDVWDARGDDHKWEFFGFKGWDRKWESGGFNAEEGIIGTATEGWETYSDASKKSDGDGNFYVAIQVGHWSEFPPFIDQHFANLAVAPVEE